MSLAAILEHVGLDDDRLTELIDAMAGQAPAAGQVAVSVRSTLEVIGEHLIAVCEEAPELRRSEMVAFMVLIDGLQCAAGDLVGELLGHRMADGEEFTRVLEAFSAVSEAMGDLVERVQASSRRQG